MVHADFWGCFGQMNWHGWQEEGLSEGGVTEIVAPVYWLCVSTS